MTRPIGSGAWGDLDDVGELPPFYAATAAGAASVFLVVIEAYNLVTEQTEELFFSDVGYTSPRLGINSDRHFECRAIQPLRMSWGIPVAPEVSRLVSLEIGAIELNNADHLLDDLPLNYDIGGRKITVLVGLRGMPYAFFTPIFTGRGITWQQSGRELQISARDGGYLFEVPFQSSYYGGAGGADGTSSLTGRAKPVAIGNCLNVSPVLVDPSNLVYQVNDRTTHQVQRVRDMGVELTSSAPATPTDYADYSALVGATIAAGDYATCKAEGLFRLGSAPVGQVTADVFGKTFTAGGQTQPADAFQLVLTDWFGLDASGINSGAITRFNISWRVSPVSLASFGIYFDGSSTFTVAQALSQIMAGTCGWWGVDPDGIVTIGRIGPTPAPETVSLEFLEWDIKSAELMAPPPGSEQPRYRQNLYYRKNYTPQAPNQLAAGVTPLLVQQYGLPFYLTQVDEDLSVRDTFLLATEGPPVELLLVNVGVFPSFVSILNGQRKTYRVSVDQRGLRAKRNTIVAVTHSRVNGGDRWLGRLIGMEIDAARRSVDLILWG